MVDVQLEFVLGRALLNINQSMLSKWASINVATLKRIEGSAEIRGTVDTIRKIQRALEAAGVEFIPEEPGRGPGVHLKQPQDRPS